MSATKPGAPAVRFQHPEFPRADDVERYFTAARTVGWYSNFGPCVQLLEGRLAKEYLAGWPAVTAASATAGLLLAQRAVFGRPHRRPLVAVPSLTFVASLSAIEWSGYTPLYVDMDSADWQLSPTSLDEALTTHAGEVAGVMLTTTFGTPLSVDKAKSIAAVLRRHEVAAVVDAAAGLGGTYPSDLARAWVFSMHATKPVGVGEGGVVACESEELARQVRSLSNFGFGRDRRDVIDLGLNAKMSELTAAVGLAVLDHAPEWITARRASARRILDNLDQVGVESQPGAAASPRQFLPIAVANGMREQVVRAAGRLSVETRRYFDPPLHRLTCSRGAAAVALGNTDILSERLLCLPLSARMTFEEEELVVRAVRDGLSVHQ